MNSDSRLLGTLHQAGPEHGDDKGDGQAQGDHLGEKYGVAMQAHG